MTATKKSSATTVKGIAATAAGVVVLLGGIGTFALWNQDLAIGTDQTATGTLNASFDELAWEDVTPGESNPIDPLEDFRMVPGDTIEGTTTVTVTTQGENLRVVPEVAVADGTLPAPITAEVTLQGTDGSEISELRGSNEEETRTLEATVTLHFDPAATGNKTESLNLDEVSIALQQVVDPAVTG